MQIEVKLFATFRDRLPSGSGSFSCSMDVEPGATIRDVLQRLEITEHESKIILVNGLHAQPQDALQEGDVLSVFPPLAGG